MIPAKDALQLSQARISDNDRVDVQLVMEKIDLHIRKYMTFGGPTPLEIPYKAMSKTASQIICYVMKMRFKWTVNVNLMAEPPRFQGGQPVPSHWVLQFHP